MLFVIGFELFLSSNYNETSRFNWLGGISIKMRNRRFIKGGSDSDVKL